MPKVTCMLCAWLLLAGGSCQSPESFGDRILRLREALEVHMAEKGFDSLGALPPVWFKPELDANARFERDTIWVGRVQAAFETDADLMSLLYHEYMHSVFARQNRFPVAVDTSGKIVQWDTEEWYLYQPSDYRIERSMRAFQDSVLPTYGPLNGEQRRYQLMQMRKAVSAPQSLPFQYAPSNLSLEEIAAYEAQLDAAASGWLPLSVGALAEIQERIHQQKDTYARRKAYEEKWKLGPDGTPV